MTVGLQGLASLLMQGYDPRERMINEQIQNRRTNRWMERALENQAPVDEDGWFAVGENGRGRHGPGWDRVEKNAQKQLNDELYSTDHKGPLFDNMAPRKPEIYGTGDEDFQKKSDDRFMSMEEAAEIEAKAQRFRNRLYTADIMTDYMTDRSEGKRRDEEIMIQKLMAMIEAQKALQAQLGVGRQNQQQGEGGGFGVGIPGVQQAGTKGGY